MLFKLAFRELFHNWKISLFFILNLSVGLTGYVTLDAFNDSLKSYLDENAKKILSADIAIGARREITSSEINLARDIVGKSSSESETYEFFAMLNFGKEARLVSVKAIDQNYPFYGELYLESKTTIGPLSQKDIIDRRWAWAAPELKHQLGVQKGSEVSLGSLKLQIHDFIERDSTQVFRSAAIAPRIYISRKFLKESGLIKFGSTFRHTYLFHLANESEAAEKQKQLYKAITDPAVDIEIPKTAGEDSGRQLGYLTDYLGLVALIAIFLSSLGAAYVYRLFLSQRLKEIAIYRTLGLQSYEAISVYLIQTAILGTLALFPTMLVAGAFLPALTFLLNKLVPFILNPTISSESALFGFLFAVVVSFLITLPFILKIASLKPSKLFSEEKFSAALKIQNPVSFLPAVLALWILSVTESHSLKTGSIFFFSLFGVLVIFFVLGWLFFGLFSKNNLQPWYFRYGLKSMARLRASSVAGFVALGLGTLLINILPQIKTSLQSEFYSNPNSRTPSLFLFDIQDDQINSLETFLEQQNIKMILKSPLVRAKIQSINDKPYERLIEGNETFRTREEERDARFRNRGVNLSYRATLSESEEIIEGKPITTIYQSSDTRPAKLSVESGFAERVGLSVGDRVLFDVQGIPVQGIVLNLRKVKWNTFQPNFFILVEPGVLDEAPKTYITALPKIPEGKKNELQGQIARTFPNVSILDVEKTVAEILDRADQMSWSLELMAALALLVGYVVMYSIIRNQVTQRRWEINMLKILGSTFKEIRYYLLVESLAVSLLAAVLGSLISIVVSFSLTMWVFKTAYSFNIWVPVISIGFVVATAVTVSLLAARRVLLEKPLVILRET